MQSIRPPALMDCDVQGGAQAVSLRTVSPCSDPVHEVSGEPDAAKVPQALLGSGSAG